ncbi:uncharacterized protein PADG_00543 [Paracoccidioides brasiliensis Pb18]|uniref:Uncharacterized protein n=1 Tax=Paracoccidioides brasiliensis (strain Pb18) TaxID=502780 RepID=C1G103_PARBD|nr:uncharacterized protein PADG_00543 [Paracoccidioides brasiliensis Pb18]EEH44254.2 hypothetical protein PADG_00543 [Paracoccidioides brasiliensis Pb18]
MWIRDEFLGLCAVARKEAMKDMAIRTGFKATGLMPYNPEGVLTRLQSQLHTHSPPGTSHGSQSPWIPKPPCNVAQLEGQSDKIKQRIKRRTQSPSSPTNQALNQLVRWCQLAMHSAAILTQENKVLWAANEKQKCK